MKRKFGAAIFGVIGAMAAGTASAEERLGIGVQLGTAGAGAELQYKISNYATARVGWSYLDFSADRTIDGIRYDGDIEFKSYAFLADYHPFANGFHLTGGVYWSPREVRLDAAPTGPVEIGDLVFTPEQVGRLEGRADWREVAPYIGLGYKNTFTKEGRIGFQASIGVAAIGSPDVALAAVGGLLASDPSLQTELDREAESIKDDLDDVPVHPIISIGLNYRF